MSRPTHYSPVISRFLVSVLYHEAKRRQIPMTRLADEILKQSLLNSPGWHIASSLRVEEGHTQPVPSQSAA